MHEWGGARGLTSNGVLFPRDVGKSEFYRGLEEATTKCMIV